MKLNKQAYKDSEWKSYKVKMVYTWTVTATSKKSALGMIDNEIEHPKWIEDNDYIYPDNIEVVDVITDDHKPTLIYRKEVV